jgi:hypothetical protein
MTASQEELGYAVMLASAVVPVICAMGYLILSIENGDVSAVAIVFATLVFFVLGWPCALVLGALLAIVFGSGVQEGRRNAVVGTIACATVFGTVGVPLVWNYFNGSDEVATMAVAGAVAGLVAGKCFCSLAEHSPRTGDSQQPHDTIARLNDSSVADSG